MPGTWHAIEDMVTRHVDMLRCITGTWSNPAMQAVRV